VKRAGLLSAGGGPGSYALNLILEGARKLFGRGRPLAVDWRRTTAYGFPLYMRWGGVALNVAGEQPAGKVSPEELPAVAEEVKSALSACRAGGPRPVEWVKTREELYAGPAAGDLPHLVFQSRPDVVVAEGKGPGPLVGAYRDAAKKGEHAVEAMALVAGGGAPAGARLEMKLEDVAATVAYMAGLDWRVMDGEPWGKAGAR
jgi:predicted AlkP superfamily phosphohydrolase/phosphomutase